MWEMPPPFGNHHQNPLSDPLGISQVALKIQFKVPGDFILLIFQSGSVPHSNSQHLIQSPHLNQTVSVCV